jgi:MFS family permease
MHSFTDRANDIDSPAAWLRLAAGVAISTIGAVGMWSVVVVLPAVQAEFSIPRADASLPYTLAMLGFASGGIVTGRLVDRFGLVLPLIGGTLALFFGYALAAAAGNVWQFGLAHALLIGPGASVVFGPLMANVSQWFVRRRGIAVALVATGSYLAGTFWPPVLQHFVATMGWRATHVGVGIVCAVMMLPLALAMRQRPAARLVGAPAVAPAGAGRALPIPPRLLQALLCVAAVACCVAMAMPQVHIVAYCGDLGYGVAHGADMLALMLGCGIVSRVASGFIADRIGPLATLLVGSVLQGSALLLYLAFDSLSSLYVISALFGLFQGGIVPMYALIVREFFPPHEAATRFGAVLFASVLGMALGGWMSGAIFDLFGSYRIAFANGVLWNLLNLAIVLLLLVRTPWRTAPA